MEPNKYRSEEINQIMGSLSKAQGSYKPLVANQDGPGGKFANLKAIIESVREALSLNGIAFYQYTELLDEGSGAEILKTMLGHESGQWIASFCRIIRGTNERQTGNMYELAKCRQAMKILGIAPSENDPMNFNDNGDGIDEQKLINEVRKPKEPKKEVIDRKDTVSKDQYEELLIELNGEEKIAQDILEIYKIETLADLPRSEYHKARARIMRIKRLQEEYELKR